MSMSQEEIEALMNGLDEPAPEKEELSVDESTEETTDDQSAEMSTDDIENLIAQTQNSDDENSEADSSEENANDIDDLLAQLDEADSEDVKEEPKEELSEDSNEESAKEESSLESMLDEVDDEEKSVDTSDIDDLLAGIDGITNDEPVISSDPELPESKDDDETNEAIARAWTNDKVDQGVFPSPVEPDTKVVGQLSQVANDSEEKAGLIFDVLSLILDENNEIQRSSKQADEFIDSQIKLLATLSEKFPNISMFKEQLEVANSLQGKGKEASEKIDNVNMKIFEAMEQMQFFDINRQKIERVMSVIKKLSNYLNNLFEDAEGYKDVQIAKHIHGDSTDGTVADEDLEALIAEFNK